MASVASFVPSTEALSQQSAYKTVQLATLPENQYCISLAFTLTGRQRNSDVDTRARLNYITGKSDIKEYRFINLLLKSG